MKQPLSLSIIVLVGVLAFLVPAGRVNGGIPDYLPSISWLNPYSYSLPSWRRNTAPTPVATPKEEFDRSDTFLNSSRINPVADNRTTNSPMTGPNQTITTPQSSLDADRAIIKPKLINDVIVAPTSSTTPLPRFEIPTQAPATTLVDMVVPAPTEAPLLTMATIAYKPGTITDLFTTKKPTNLTRPRVSIKHGGKLYEHLLNVSTISPNPSQSSVQIYDGEA